jgi:type IV pilus assembly protein PilB
MSTKLGEMLVAANMITPEQLRQALEHQKSKGGRLGYSLIKLGFVSEEEVTSLLSKQYGLPAINLSQFEIDPEVLKIVSQEICEKYMVIAVSRSGATITVAMADPTNIYALDDIKFTTGYNVQPVVASEVAIKEALDKYYGMKAQTGGLMDKFSISSEGPITIDANSLEIKEESDEIDLGKLESESGDASVISLVNVILADSVAKGASDIHIECYEKDFRIRFRIDGILYEVLRPKVDLKNAIISRVKIMAKLDIAERRLPQDGRIMVKMKDKAGKVKELDLRVSVLPCLFGEKVVMRLLDKENLMLDMTKLGLEPSSLDILKDAITRPYGMVLVTGPTGSGKTNTLYSALGTVNTPDVNILTAEDPVEFNIQGINQVQMHDKIGLNFAAALRSFLRQDPDIIMVGEIRDFETAEIAIKAALTGHLVFSTLHTNDAPSTINRLMNMGIEPFLVATSVLMIVAQRLGRKLCQTCKEETKVPADALIRMGFTPEEAETIKVFKPVGCQKCNETGYKGRIGYFEAMKITDPVKELILSGASAMELKKQAIDDGMITLRRSGLTKVMNGITSIEEVITKTVA